MRNAAIFARQALDCGAHAGAALLLGTIRLQQGRRDSARLCFERAVLWDPACAPAYNNLSYVQCSLGDPWTAEETARAGLLRDSGFEPLYRTLSQALQQQGRAREALAILDGAPGEARPETLCNRGSLHAALGEREAAEHLFAEAISRFPAYADAYFLFSGAHRFTADDPHIAVIEAFAARLPAQSPEAAWLHFALGKAYDETGERETAFSHFARGNALTRAGFSYDPAMATRSFAAIRQAFSGDFAQATLRPRKRPFVPVFIVGMPRSGTTLAEQILCSHPDVAAAGETPCLQQIIGRYDGRDPASFSRRQLAAMRRTYLEQVGRYGPGARFITDKMPLNFRYAGMIRILFPEAKIIHCRRDPLDTCFSIYRHLFTGFLPFAYDLRELGLYYGAYAELTAFWQARMPGFIHELRYEALTEAPEETIAALLRFCGLAWDDSCLSFHEHDRAVMTASALQVRMPLHGTSVGLWRRYEKHLVPLRDALPPCVPAGE